MPTALITGVTGQDGAYLAQSSFSARAIASSGFSGDPRPPT